MKEKRAVIIGAGPAGLTAAYELATRTDIKPIVLEMTADIGGISKTVDYKGNRIDIGGHRFFSKSARVMEWWLNILPLQEELPSASEGKTGLTPVPEEDDQVMLLRNRLSRIYFLRRFFQYPLTFNPETLTNLGSARAVKIGFSYLKAKVFPIRRERSLEDFFINRFGKELYDTFFKDYTEKVWGVPCSEIDPDWGAQRIKGLSVMKTLLHAARKAVSPAGIGDRRTETSLIEQFYYPKLGPGQLWERVAEKIRDAGGEIHLNCKVVGVGCDGRRATGVTVLQESSGLQKEYAADFVFSTMPVRDLVEALGEKVPAPVRTVSRGLMYRDFITVGLLLKKLNIGKEIKDNWIYIQEREVKLGRLQIFNNWSPYMVRDPDTVWVGLEYFCFEGDALWNLPDEDLCSFAVNELASIDIIRKEDVKDATVLRMPKAYPAYFGTYAGFETIREYTDGVENLFLIGRNGMHRYNNSDHSMLTAMTAVDNIVSGEVKKDRLWKINTEHEYLEEEAPQE